LGQELKNPRSAATIDIRVHNQIVTEEMLSTATVQSGVHRALFWRTAFGSPQ